MNPPEWGGEGSGPDATGEPGPPLARPPARWGAVAAVAAIVLVAGVLLLPSWLDENGHGSRHGAARDSTGSSAAAGSSAEYDYEAPVPGTYELPALDRAGDGRVLDVNGSPVGLRKVMEGRVTLLSFIYTRCADATACPMATGVLRDIHAASRKDPEMARALRLITFSFDPEYDTPSVMARYESYQDDQSGGAEWLFLTSASPSEMAPILARYGMRVDRKPNANDPLGPFYHLLRVYLIDRKGMIRNIYSTGLLDPRLVLADVRTLMMEDAKERVAAGP